MYLINRLTYFNSEIQLQCSAGSLCPAVISVNSTLRGTETPHYMRFMKYAVNMTVYIILRQSIFVKSNRKKQVYFIFNTVIKFYYYGNTSCYLWLLEGSLWLGTMDFMYVLGGVNVVVSFTNMFYSLTSLYPFGNGFPPTSAVFKGRTCRQLPRCWNPGQSHVISAPITSNM